MKKLRTIHFLKYCKKSKTNMDESNRKTDTYKKKISLLISKSKKDFMTEYSQFSKLEEKEFFLQLLSEIAQAIKTGNVEKMKEYSYLIDFMRHEKHCETVIENCLSDADNPLRNTNLVILASKSNQVDILEFLFSESGGNLCNLCADDEQNANLLEGKDGEGHNAFYYAMKLGDVKLLEILIDKWPGNCFIEVKDILSKVYEELKLKNVLVSDAIAVFVENWLINARFFCNDSVAIKLSNRSPKNAKESGSNDKGHLNSIKGRISLVLENINQLKTEYSHQIEKKVDSRFLFLTKFVSQNIHILKQKLKCTYTKLPWEEIEFCLVCFISSFTAKRELNLFCHIVLSKDRILKHLDNFAKSLQVEMNVVEKMDMRKLFRMPNIERSKVMADIICVYPQFEELYKDYEAIRDVYSLERIREYLQLASMTDPGKEESRLIIMRALQVTGEHLKSSLQSPKLSKAVSELLIILAPINTRDIIIDLRDSLSHANSLFKRNEMEENQGICFFAKVQNDVKKIGIVIASILNNIKIKIIREILCKIIASESLSELKDIGKYFVLFPLNETELGIEARELKKIEKLIDNLSKQIVNKTEYEKGLIHQINKIINAEKISLENNEIDYLFFFSVFITIFAQINDADVLHYDIIKEIKVRANKALCILAPKINSWNMNTIVDLTIKLVNSIGSRMKHDDQVKLIITNISIHFISLLGTENIKWVEEFKEILREPENITLAAQKKTSKKCKASDERFRILLSSKLFTLENVLKNKSLCSSKIGNSTPKSTYKNSEIAIEMLLLDILSILDSSKNILVCNNHFLDDYAPSLTGLCLRNHLAHDNILISVLPTNPSLAVISNAKIMIEENLLENCKKIGTSMTDDPTKMKNKFIHGLAITTICERMFVALEEGDLKEVHCCIKNGADIHSRSYNLWTALHFAAKGPSLEVVKFVLEYHLCENAKDICGQSPLHIAAAFGRKNTVEYFVEERGLPVDVVGYLGRTPLHLAAKNGHKDVVEVLLKNKANPAIKDYKNKGNLPIHYAVLNNHKDVVKILFDKELNADSSTSVVGFTSLHVAAELGSVELVDFFLQNDANVNARTDNGWVPLHAAAKFGHLDVLNHLIAKGADVDSKVVYDYTALCFAVEEGHEVIVQSLLEHGAKVNVSHKIHKITPLHEAAMDGYLGIVKILLCKKANINAKSITSMTPLHLAARYGHRDVLDVLIRNNARIHDENYNGCTALHLSAYGGHKDVVKLLIEKGCNINARDKKKWVPLHYTVCGHSEEIGQASVLEKRHAIVNDTICSNTNCKDAENNKLEVLELLLQNQIMIDAKDENHWTALHLAVKWPNNGGSVKILLKYGSDINLRDKEYCTPLHIAAGFGNKDSVLVLIEGGADVNAKNGNGLTPLHLAVKSNHKDIVENLIDLGAEVDSPDKNGLTPLCYAAKNNFKEIIRILIDKDVDVNAAGGIPIITCVSLGSKNIVEMLVKVRNININCRVQSKYTPLHMAAAIGDKRIAGILLANGANVNAVVINDETPLATASKKGHKEVAEILILHGADVNFRDSDGATPLHGAATLGHMDVVKMLLSHKANSNVHDKEYRLPLELAVDNCHFEVVQMLLKCKDVCINSKGKDNWTLLHIASDAGNLEIVKCLLENGADMHARKGFGAKPVHIAARGGHTNIVEYFLSKGLSINEQASTGCTLLHYAAMNGQIKVAKFLIEKNADVNAIDGNGQTPLHISAFTSHLSFTLLLLNNGANYDAVDNQNKKPHEIASDQGVINCLKSTRNLFKAVKQNCPSGVEKCIREGAVIDARDKDNTMPLHLAAWKGYVNIVKILLKNKANPNAVCKGGCTPLHYASKSSHILAVKTLLSNGAIYEALTDNFKTPLDYAINDDIRNLLILISRSFEYVQNANTIIIRNLLKIKDADTMKALMNARNKQNRSIMVVAICNDFPEIEKLKEVFQDETHDWIREANLFIAQGNYNKALHLYKKVLEKRKEFFGPDNPVTLEIQRTLALKILCQLDKYHLACKILKETEEKQKEIFGENHRETLRTESAFAFTLYMQGNHKEALKKYREVHEIQNKILGESHPDTSESYLHMALVLEALEEYDEALYINSKIYDERKQTLGIEHPLTLISQNNIAMVLSKQGKYDAALEIYEKVYKMRRTVLGPHHPSTLKVIHNIAVTLLDNKQNQDIKLFRKLFNIQKEILGLDHMDTLNTECNIGNLLFDQGKYIGAYKAFMRGLQKRKDIFGSCHPNIMDTLEKLKLINLKFKLEGNEMLQDLLQDHCDSHVEY